MEQEETNSPESTRLETTKEEASTGASVAAPEVVIDKWIYGGAGLGRWNGQVVLAPFTLPGEQIRFEIDRKRTGLLDVRVTERLTESPERIDPACPYFVRCGGCHYQHAPYGFQVDRKREILAETLQRVGKIAPPAEIPAVCGEPWGYRNRSQFHLAAGDIGYLAAGSHKLVPVEQCPISSPRLNETLRTIRRMMKDRRWPGFIRSIELFTNESETMVNVVETEGGKRVARSFFDWCAAGIRGASAGEMLYKTGSEAYRVSHGAFFQVNRFLIDSLVAAALSGAGGESALDLYSGVGLFSIALGRRFKRVAAVEASTRAVRDLQANAASAGLEIETHKMNAEQFLESAASEWDFVLADPPRAGLGAKTVEHLLRLKPPRLAIVSCDPATLARDLNKLIAGGYRLRDLSLIDLFPQTFHIESVANLALA